ncbi:MAG TPA: SDR family oxidoreductase [Solirubrobacteraceae bacterium]|nr:SDR family oxidoreductase [Solirubrobacteraceae bacterium]
MSTETLEGRTVLITGAGAGLGRGVALAAGRAGAHVIVTSLGENGRETAEAIVAAGGLATWIVCDVTDRDAVERAVAEAVEVSGRLDGLVHNAFARPRFDDPRASSVAELPFELWQHEVSVALRGAYHCATAGFPHLRDSRGRLILLSSTSGVEGTPTQPAYAACKGAIRAMTKSLAREWGPLGITVNAVSPYVTTPSFDAWWDKNPELKAEGEALTVLGYIGDPLRDAGPPFVFLLGAGSHYLTGQTFFIDSGRYLSY